MLIDFQIGFFRRLRPFGRLLLRYGNASLLSDPNELDAVIADNVAESMGLQSALFAAGQTTGEFRAGDATVLAHLFSGLMAAYQSVDPSDHVRWHGHRRAAFVAGVASNGRCGILGVSRADVAPDPTTMWSSSNVELRRHPMRLFLVDDDGRRLTFSEFRQAAHETAAGLTAHGIGPGTVVAWALPTKIDTCVLMAALSRLSVVQVPIVPIYREREVSHITREAEVDVVLVGSPQHGVDYAVDDSVLWRRIAAVAPGYSSSKGRSRRAAQAFCLHLPSPLGRTSPTPSGGTSTRPARREGQREYGTPTAVWPPLREGWPPIWRWCRLTAADSLSRLPMLEGPSTCWPVSSSGTALILIESFDPPRAVETLRREGVTMAGSGTAFHLGYLDVQRQYPHTPIFPRLRCCPGGGAPKPPGLHRQVKEELGGAGILSGWGLTEAPVLTMGRPNDPDEKLSLTEGRPLAGRRTPGGVTGGHGGCRR